MSSASPGNWRRACRDIWRGWRNKEAPSREPLLTIGDFAASRITLDDGVPTDQPHPELAQPGCPARGLLRR